MHYDPNYKNQFFHDSSNSIGIKEAINIARREIAVSEYKTKMPKSKLSKVMTYSILGVSALVLLATALIFVFSRSFLFTIVMFVIMAFASVAVNAIVIAIVSSILNKRCTEPVEATCIGYSMSGSSDHDSSAAGGLERTPVFEYDYHGFKCVAFDGVYDNFSKLPFVSQKTTILVNPDDPEDIYWNFGKHRSVFLILACVFGSVLSISMFFVVINDENFMNSAFSENEPQTEVSSMQNPGSEIASEEETFTVRKTDDGRIILDNPYLRNEVFKAYPFAEYVVKKRKITDVEVIDEGASYAVYFEPDSDFSESEWFFFGDDVTDEVRNASKGDEFIYAEVTDVGASWIFSTKEYALENE